MTTGRSRKHNVIVVGAGLFGAMAALFAHRAGHRVTVIDAEKKYRASPASGCVLAPSWLTSIPKDDVALGLKLLDEYYGREDLDFGIPGFRASRVKTADVLNLPLGIMKVYGEVISVYAGGVEYHDITGTRCKLRGKVLLAAGIWCSELLGGLPAMQGLYGAALSVSGQIPSPRLKVYAPYRQAVAFNMDAKHVWFGDGTALIQKTWMKEEEHRVVATVERMKRYAGLLPDVRHLRSHIGARPYMKGHMGYYARVSDSLWVSTGGAKNGTLLAALQAHKFVNDLKEAK